MVSKSRHPQINVSIENINLKFTVIIGSDIINSISYLYLFDNCRWLFVCVIVKIDVHAVE